MRTIKLTRTVDMVMHGAVDEHYMSLMDAAAEAISAPGEAQLLPTGAKIVYHASLNEFLFLSYAHDGRDVSALYHECDAAEECTGPIEYLPVTQPTSTDDDDEEEP